MFVIKLPCHNFVCVQIFPHVCCTSINRFFFFILSLVITFVEECGFIQHRLERRIISCYNCCVRQNTVHSVLDRIVMHEQFRISIKKNPNAAVCYFMVGSLGISISFVVAYLRWKLWLHFVYPEGWHIILNWSVFFLSALSRVRSKLSSSSMPDTLRKREKCCVNQKIRRFVINP